MAGISRSSLFQSTSLKRFSSLTRFLTVRGMTDVPREIVLPSESAMPVLAEIGSGVISKTSRRSLCLKESTPHLYFWRHTGAQLAYGEQSPLEKL